MPPAKSIVWSSIVDQPSLYQLHLAMGMYTRTDQIEMNKRKRAGGTLCIVPPHTRAALDAWSEQASVGIQAVCSRERVELHLKQSIC